MARYIDYDRMVDFVSACGLNTKLFEMKHKDEIVEDIRPNLHAKWINRRKYYDYYTDDEIEIMECSNCGIEVEIGEFSEPYLYCHTCGAVMDKE